MWPFVDDALAGRFKSNLAGRHVRRFRGAADKTRLTQRCRRPATRGVGQLIIIKKRERRDSFVRHSLKLVVELLGSAFPFQSARQLGCSCSSRSSGSLMMDVVPVMSFEGQCARLFEVKQKQVSACLVSRCRRNGTGQKGRPCFMCGRASWPARGCRDFN